jgi:predicted aspartyl protease
VFVESLVFDGNERRPPIRALFGAGLFADCLLTLDLAGKTAVLEPSGALPDPDGADVLPIRMINGCPPVRVRIGKRREWALIDSGFGGSLALSPKLARELPLAAPPVPGPMGVGMFGDARSSFARVAGDVRLGRHVFRRPVVTIGKNDDRVLIGTELLRHFTVSIDQRQRVARFTRTPGSGGGAIDLGGYESLGFTFTRSEKGYFVTDVHPRL